MFKYTQNQLLVKKGVGVGGQPTRSLKQGCRLEKKKV
jgi:hypothetical protein